MITVPDSGITESGALGPRSGYQTTASMARPDPGLEKMTGQGWGRQAQTNGKKAHRDRERKDGLVATRTSPVILRVRTHLITDKDDLLSVVRRYTKDVAEPGDIVGISESVVAIMQGRAIPPETVKPSMLAKCIARFAHPDASVSAPRSMQVAIEMVGVPRILMAAASGLWGKITRKKGLFFRVAGHEVAEIDDSGGTMPPYDRSIILGPKDAHAEARKVWRHTGLWLLILDVNDKGAVDILGSSMSLTPQRETWIKELLRSNQFGNDDQKTPLVIIKPSAGGGNLELTS
jgi:hypothetical protein